MSAFINSKESRQSAVVGIPRTLERSRLKRGEREGEKERKRERERDRERER